MIQLQYYLACLYENLRGASGVCYCDRRRHGCRRRAYMDVFTACRNPDAHQFVLQLDKKLVINGSTGAVAVVIIPVAEIF